MSPSPTDVRQLALTPVRKYQVNGVWDQVEGRSLASPASDGTVIYYQDTLSYAQGTDGDGELGFNPYTADAICQYLTALAVRRGVDIVDGPYLQVLEDDGAVPPGWVMLRALIWVDEYDLVVEVDPAACADAGLTADPVGGGVGV